jgi:hypothetical protein
VSARSYLAAGDLNAAERSVDTLVSLAARRSRAIRAWLLRAEIEQAGTARGGAIAVAADRP